jgi:hypothetical protein
MKRHTGKKVVNPQWQTFELLSGDLWHSGLLRGIALAFFDLPRTDKMEAVDESSTTSLIANNSPRMPLGRCLKLAVDGSQELLCTGRASHSNNQWPHIGEGSNLKC